MKNSIADEFEENHKRSPLSSLDNVSFYYPLIFISVITFGIYVGNLLFGNYSLEVFIKLDRKKDSLEERVESLKQSNAKLQREYFELKELEP